MICDWGLILFEFLSVNVFEYNANITKSNKASQESHWLVYSLRVPISDYSIRIFTLKYILELCILNDSIILLVAMQKKDFCASLFIMIVNIEESIEPYWVVFDIPLQWKYFCDKTLSWELFVNKLRMSHANRYHFLFTDVFHLKHNIWWSVSLKLKFKPRYELTLLVFIEYRRFHEGFVLVYFFHTRMASGQIKHASCLISKVAVNFNSILFYSINNLIIDYKLNKGFILASAETYNHSIHCNVIFTSAHDHIH